MIVFMLRNNSLNELVKVILSFRSEEQIKDFLEGILTSNELIEISTRLQIVKMLKKGVPQHKIADSLNVGVATVTRGSKEIQNGRFKNI